MPEVLGDPKPVKILIVAVIVLLCGCSVGQPNVGSTGPVTITQSTFYYHITVRRDDGVDHEFYYAEYQTDFDKGSVVDISYTCPWETNPWDLSGIQKCKITGKRFLKKPRDADAPKKEIAHLLSEAGYYDLIVMEELDNAAIAKVHKASECGWSWRGTKVGAQYSSGGVVCDKSKIVVTQQ